MANAVNLGNMLVGNEVNLGDLQIANAVSIVYTAGDNITISDDRVISAIVPTKTSDLLNDSGYITNDTDELVNYTTTSQLNTLLSEKANANDVYTKTESDNKYSTIPETGNKIEVSIDSVTYIMSLNLKDKNNNILSTAEVDLPLESVVVNGRYDDTTKELILTLQNGNEIRISVADLISGLQETLVAGNNIQLVGNTISATDTTYTLSASTSGDITTITLTGSDASTSTAVVDLTDINQDIADIQAEQTVQNIDIDDLYNLLPTVTDTGESLELNNTGSAKLKSISLGGNASQTTYTGKNLFNKDNVNVLNAYFNAGSTNTITFSNSARTIYIQCKSNTTYTVSKITSARFYVGYTETTPANGVEVFGRDGANDLSTPLTITTGNNATYLVAFIYITSADTLTPQQIYDSVQIEESATATTYEPYVGGIASPNPDYPQDVHVVRGNNTVKVEGKNLLQEGFRQGNTTGTNNNRLFTINSTLLKANQPYIISTDLDTASYYWAVRCASIPFPATANILSPGWVTVQSYAYTPTQDCYLGIMISKRDTNATISVSDIAGVKFQVEKGETATTYEPYQKQEYPLYLGGNVFKLSDIEENKSLMASEGLVGTSSVSNISGYTPVIGGLDYNLTFDYTSLLNTNNRSMCYYDKDKVFIRGNSFAITSKSHTFTMPDNAEYVRFSYDKNCVDISLSTDATPIELCKAGDYQDYLYKENGKWYKYGAIGKVVLNGSENWVRSENTSETNFVGVLAGSSLTNTIKCLFNSVDYSYVSHFTLSASLGSNEGYSLYNRVGVIYNALAFSIDISNVADIQAFKTWLSKNNTTFYYVLETPTTTEITDTTLIAQLDNLEKARSYKTQTNIAQDNADKPFIITASAFKDLSSL